MITGILHVDNRQIPLKKFPHTDNIRLQRTAPEILLQVFRHIYPAFLIQCITVLIKNIDLYRTAVPRQFFHVIDKIFRLNLKEGRGYEEVETDIEELQMLSHSVKEMSDDLQESLQEIIALKEYELHAKLLALQAQMQPHFLFNTLMNITSLAEEEGNERIYRICMNLTGMFRYISADNPEGVNLYEEIRHVENYVDIMKERFPESYVRIDIPL